MANRSERFTGLSRSAQPQARLNVLTAQLLSASNPQNPIALIVGGGPGISASCAKLFSQEGFRVAIAARSTNKPEFQMLAKQYGVRPYACDATEPAQVAALFDDVTRDLGGFPDLVVYNASGRDKGPITDIDAEKVKQGLLVSAFGGFNVAQHSARGMIPRGSGTLLFTGASASYKGYANSSSFAMGKFGLHGLAQSLARELGPKGIHVAHFPVDGGVGKVDANGEKTSHWARYQATTTDEHVGTRAASQRQGTNGDVIDDGDTMLHPDAIAQTYLFAHRQHRSAWTFDFQLRPWGEKW